MGTVLVACFVEPSRRTYVSWRHAVIYIFIVYFFCIFNVYCKLLVGERTLVTVQHRKAVIQAAYTYFVHVLTGLGAVCVMAVSRKSLCSAVVVDVPLFLCTL